MSQFETKFPSKNNIRTCGFKRWCQFNWVNKKRAIRQLDVTVQIKSPCTWGRGETVPVTSRITVKMTRGKVSSIAVPCCSVSNRPYFFDGSFLRTASATITKVVDTSAAVHRLTIMFSMPRTAAFCRLGLGIDRLGEGVDPLQSEVHWGATQDQNKEPIMLYFIKSQKS